VHVFDAMPSVGRKFLLAGKGGLNLTHSEPFARLCVNATASAAPHRAAAAATLGRATLRAWAQGWASSTFVGTSQRVFPTDMKAAPLLRAWLHCACVQRRGAFTCAIAGWAGMPTAPCALPPPAGAACRPPRCWRWAAPAGRAGLRRRLGAAAGRQRGVAGGAAAAGQLRL
jgi:hypothetical protein